MKKFLLFIFIFALPVNAQMISGNVEYQIEKDRKIAIFSDGSKGVMYNNTPLIIKYYNSDADLIYIETKTQEQYPHKAFKYTPDGELVNVSLRISEKESFIYNLKGKLIGHWVGDNCYNQNGQVVMTRKTMK